MNLIIKSKHALLFSIISAVLLLSENVSAKNSSSDTIAGICDTVSKTDSTDQSIRILCTGDIMIHRPILNSVKTRTGKKYNFLPTLEHVSALLKQGDITIGNLETVLAGDNLGFSGYPTFNSPKVLASDLKESGFTLLTTTNNHSFDKGTKGLKSTIRVLDSAGIQHTGTFEDTGTLDRSLILNVKGSRIGLISYSYGTNGELSKRIARHINLIDTTQISSDIKSLHDRNVTFIIAAIHFGNEYQMMPSENQKQLVQFLWNNGVQIIFGHHPHVLQPAVFDSLDNRFVIFSLGNFISNQSGANKEFGGIADIIIEKSPTDSALRIRSAKIHSTCVFLRSRNSHPQYSILLLDSFKDESFSSKYPKYFSKKADTLSFINNHLQSLDGIFSYDDRTKITASDSSR